MRALGIQGLQIVRHAARSAAELEHQMAEIDRRSDELRLDTLPAVGALESNPPKVSRTPRKRKPKAAAATPALSPPVFDREALRLKLEAAAIRPMPGASELLSRALHTEFAFGYTEGGKLTNDAESHDLMALAPIHLKQREEK